MSSRDIVLVSAGVAVGLAAYYLYRKYGSFTGVCTTAVKEFKKLDTDGDGRVSFEEFSSAMKSTLGEQYNEWESAMKRIWGIIVENYYTLDTDGDGSVSTAELLAAIKAQLGRAWNNITALTDPYLIPMRTFVQAGLRDYKSLDVNNDGEVSEEEFINGMKERMGEQWTPDLEEKSKIVYDIIQKADVNRDGSLSPQEFYDYVRNHGTDNIQKLVFN